MTLKDRAVSRAADTLPLSRSYFFAAVAIFFKALSLF